MPQRHSRFATSRTTAAGVVTLVAAVALGLAAPTMAQAAQTASVVQPGVPTQFTVVANQDMPASAMPIVGDFNDDGRDDILWYAAGRGFDQLMLAGPGRVFSRHSITINGTYEPLSGDFNGDHHLDILWYAPGPSPDFLWLGRGNGTFSTHSLTVNGLYRPLIADYNGDGRDDVLWYAPGPGRDYLGYASWSGAFSVHSLTINGVYDDVTGGDFNGDGITDLLWWAPNLTHLPVWIAKGSGGGFTSTTFSSPGAGALPMVMNVDNDARSDILWYGPGAIRDALVLGNLGYNHLIARSISGNYQPLWGNFDGDNHHRSDILWWATAPNAPDAYWAGSSGGLVSTVYHNPHVDWTSHYVAFGHFDSDGALDVLFYDSSGHDTSFYYGNDVDGPGGAIASGAASAPRPPVMPKRLAMTSFSISSAPPPMRLSRASR